MLKIITYSRAQKLKPVIPGLREAKAGGSPEVRSSRPAWPTWRNPTSTKNTKIRLGTVTYASLHSSLGNKSETPSKKYICVCVCVCIHMYMCVCVYTYVCVCVCVYT